MDLLPDSYLSDENVVIPQPTPEERSNQYTFTRLQSGLAYAQSCLKRDISPRSELFLYLYKQEVKDAMTSENEEEKEKHIKMIMIQETLIKEKHFLRPLQHQNTEMQGELLKLREVQYITRYGEYLKIIPNRLRAHAKKAKFDDWELLAQGTFWTDIAAKIAEEDAAYQLVKQKKASADILTFDTTLAVRRACYDLGIFDDLAFWSIAEYGDGNSSVHRDLDSLKKTGDFGMLAKILYADRREVNMTFSEIQSETDLDALAEIIQGEIESLFQCLDPEDPKTWVAKDLLIESWKTAKAEGSRGEVKKRNKGPKPGKEPSGEKIQGKKRVASTQEPRGSEVERGDREKVAAQRKKFLAKKLRLEHELKRVEDDLAALDRGEPHADEE